MARQSSERPIATKPPAQNSEEIPIDKEMLKGAFYRIVRDFGLENIVPGAYIPPELMEEHFEVGREMTEYGFLSLAFKEALERMIEHHASDVFLLKQEKYGIRIAMGPQIDSIGIERCRGSWRKLQSALSKWTKAADAAVARGELDVNSIEHKRALEERAYWGRIMLHGPTVGNVDRITMKLGGTHYSPPED